MAKEQNVGFVYSLQSFFISPLIYVYCSVKVCSKTTIAILKKIGDWVVLDCPVIKVQLLFEHPI